MLCTSIKYYKFFHLPNICHIFCQYNSFYTGTVRNEYHKKYYFLSQQYCSRILQKNKTNYSVTLYICLVRSTILIAYQNNFSLQPSHNILLCIVRNTSLQYFLRTSNTVQWFDCMDYHHSHMVYKQNRFSKDLRNSLHHT